MTVLEPVIDWLITSKRKKITLDQIIKGAGRPRKPVLRVMDRLVREGYAEEITNGKDALAYGEVGPMRRNPTWKILKKPLSSRPTHPTKERNIRDRIWKTIRDLRRFTRKQLKRLTGSPVGSIQGYTKLLEHHGYIRQIGKDCREKVFLLVKNPGPTRPILKERSRKKPKAKEQDHG